MVGNTEPCGHQAATRVLPGPRGALFGPVTLVAEFRTLLALPAHTSAPCPVPSALLTGPSAQLRSRSWWVTQRHDPLQRGSAQGGRRPPVKKSCLALVGSSPRVFTKPWVRELSSGRSGEGGCGRKGPRGSRAPASRRRRNVVGRQWAAVPAVVSAAAHVWKVLRGNLQRSCHGRAVRSQLCGDRRSVD